MRNLLLSIIIISVVMSFTMCSKKDNRFQETELAVFEDSVSYIIGNDIGRNIKESKIDVTNEALFRGFIDGLEGNDSLISKEVVGKIMTRLQEQFQQKQQKEMETKAKEEKAKGSKFLQENKAKEGVVELPSGLQYKVIKEGTGKQPKAENEVEVNYEGKLVNNEIFDSSYERGEPAKFVLNRVIPGWTEGLQLMKEGATYEFYIPSDLAYGDYGTPGIPGGSILIFKVELIKVNDAPAVAETPKK